MGSVGKALEDLKEQVSRLKPYSNISGTVRNPLIYDENKVDEIIGILEQRERRGNLPEPEVQSVYLDRIYTRQPYLYESKLNEFVDKSIHELAEGYIYQGDVVVTNGNHRLALAKLNNQGTVRMSVIDLDKKVRRKRR